jgi:hypothetical protein
MANSSIDSVDVPEAKPGISDILCNFHNTGQPNKRHGSCIHAGVGMYHPLNPTLLRTMM